MAYSSKISNYLKPNRLADILALIQVLSLDKLSKRSENGIFSELKITPKSSVNWITVASEHPEFFRVDNDKKQPISLIARHVTELNENGVRELPIDFVKNLFDLALELFKIEKENENKWKIWIPVIAVTVAAIINVLVTILTRK
jgi:hypothetical protein